MKLNIEFHEVLLISPRATRDTKFFTDRHFPENFKSCSELPKTCKSIKNQKSKICTRSILSSIYIEESKDIIIQAWDF